MRLPVLTAVGLILTGVSAFSEPAPATPAASVPVTVEEDVWSGAVSAYFYFPPSNRDYVQPTVAADKGRLHLEARYNYEARDTGSVWIGGNFSVGDTVALEFTPMFGVVFGETNGVAPGYKGSLSWKKLTLYSEGEYMIDSSNTADDFIYTWTELTWSPVEWLRLGVAAQHTRAYETEMDIQRGFLLGVTIRRVDLTAYVFNPDARRPLWIFAAALNF